MVLNNYRHLLPRFINKPVNFCVKHHISPNQISWIGFIISTIAAITYAFPNFFIYNFIPISSAFYWWWAGIPPLLFFFGAYVDVLDGSVARKTGQVSKFGGFLDSTLDRISDAVVIIGLVFSGMIFPWNFQINIVLGFIALSTMLLISYTRSRAEIEGVIMKGIGFMERAERIFILLGGYIIEWAIFAIDTQYFGGTYSRWFFPVFFIIFILLCIQTLYARVNWAYKWLMDKMPEKVAELQAAQIAAQNKLPSNSEEQQN